LPGIYPPAHASVAVIPNSIADRSERGLLLIAGDSICRRSEGSWVGGRSSAAGATDADVRSV